jgi:hypothetical protein
MRVILLLCLALPSLLPAFDYAGDEALRREAALTVRNLRVHGFPEPDAVTLERGTLTLRFGAEESSAPLPPAGGTLVEPLIAAELAHWGPAIPVPLAGAAAGYLSARTRGGEWEARDLPAALLQSFVMELVKDAPERLGGLWEAAGRREPWTGMERWFAFQFGISPEAFFARSVARALPRLLPFLDAIPSAPVRDGETELTLPAAAPFAASALGVDFAAQAGGLALAWDGRRVPGHALLLVTYGPPLNHFDWVDLTPRSDGITLPLAGVSRVVLLSTSPAFSRTGDPFELRAEPAEGYPCRIEGLELLPGAEGTTVSFTAVSMRDVAAFVVLRGTEAAPGRLETAGFLPGLGTQGDPHDFALVDPDAPRDGELPFYYLYAITGDGLMALQGGLESPEE